MAHNNLMVDSVRKLKMDHHWVFNEPKQIPTAAKIVPDIDLRKPVC